MYKNISHEFRFKNIDETRNHFLEEIKQNELMSKKHKKVVELKIVMSTFLFQLLNGVKVRFFFKKNTKKSTCAIMIRTIVTCANQNVLLLI